MRARMRPCPHPRPLPSSGRERGSVYAVGVDNGGTWIRLVGLNSVGRRVWSLKKPAPPLADLPSFLRRCLKPFRGEIVHLAVGSRGVWKCKPREVLRRALTSAARRVTVMSDVEAAWLAAFGNVGAGHCPRPQLNAISGRHGGLPLQISRSGIVVIAGTGSIAYGRTADGRYARAGGLGPDKGDEGSGYWIGREWLRRIPSPPEGWERVEGEGGRLVRKIASLAPLVIRKAQRNHPVAQEIVNEAFVHLGSLLDQLLRKLHWKGKVPIVFSGSVLQNVWFQSNFLKFLCRKEIPFRVVCNRLDPALAPLTLSLSHKGRGEVKRRIMGHASG
jgi:hypothetical protein